ncbi:MAG: D-alanine--D-alanine ligase [Patescibacteria group bacterium]|nr:D-alanine--D-alanine ligase [Patescibacteria group bacterium]MDE2015828.1 D-alanine--D-alanine ligase [Patescibacteria group bacterium]MDE2227203.1 D-alanine--D-alanine ligase [Patescibacteria group bacterium]
MRRNRKIRVAIVFGGKSTEHEVSLQSAKNVYESIDKDKYEVTLAGIDKTGKWHLSAPAQFLSYVENPKTAKIGPVKSGLALVPGDGGRTWIDSLGRVSPGAVDVVFPVLHGTFGEDGTVQGMLKLADVPFVGASVLGSAVGMDKDVQKRLLRDAGIPHARFAVLTKNDLRHLSYEDLAAQLGTPFFIKPANLGSSVGVHKVRNDDQFKESIHDAFLYDTKVLVEEYIQGRELECSVLGNESPMASVAGEVIPHGHEFYSYEAKYLDENGAILKIPADLPPETMENVRNLAVKTFQTLCCEGMARVDLFLKEDGKLLVNEINTIPGFTKISMYPKLWEASGLPYKKLIDKLITLAIQRFDREKKLRTVYES